MSIFYDVRPAMTVPHRERERFAGGARSFHILQLAKAKANVDLKQFDSLADYYWQLSADHVGSVTR